MTSAPWSQTRRGRCTTLPNSCPREALTSSGKLPYKDIHSRKRPIFAEMLQPQNDISPLPHPTPPTQPAGCWGDSKSLLGRKFRFTPLQQSSFVGEVGETIFFLFFFFTRVIPSTQFITRFVWDGLPLVSAAAQHRLSRRKPTSVKTSFFYFLRACTRSGELRLVNVVLRQDWSWYRLETCFVGACDTALTLLRFFF